MKTLLQFADHLREDEKSALTVEKYVRDVRAFLTWLDGQPLAKTQVLQYKAHLLENYAVADLNYPK